MRGVSKRLVSQEMWPTLLAAAVMRPLSKRYSSYSARPTSIDDVRHSDWRGPNMRQQRLEEAWQYINPECGSGDSLQCQRASGRTRSRVHELDRKRVERYGVDQGQPPNPVKRFQLSREKRHVVHLPKGKDGGGSLSSENVIFYGKLGIIERAPLRGLAPHA